MWEPGNGLGSTRAPGRGFSTKDGGGGGGGGAVARPRPLLSASSASTLLRYRRIGGHKKRRRRKKELFNACGVLRTRMHTMYTPKHDYSVSVLNPDLGGRVIFHYDATFEVGSRDWLLVSNIESFRADLAGNTVWRKRDVMGEEEKRRRPASRLRFFLGRNRCVIGGTSFPLPLPFEEGRRFACVLTVRRRRKMMVMSTMLHTPY